MPANIEILYFAALRETLACGSESLALPETVQSIADLRRFLALRGSPWDALATMKNLRAAVNQTMAHASTPIKAGDEVAFFPPVTGG